MNNSYQPSFFRLPLFFVLLTLVITVTGMLILIYPQFSQRGMSVAEYLSGRAGYLMMQMAGQFVLTSLFFYAAGISQINRKTVLCTAGLAVFFYAEKYALTTVKQAYTGSLIEALKNGETSVESVMQGIGLGDLALHLISFAILWLAVRFAGQRIIGNPVRPTLTAANSTLIYGVLLSSGVLYLMWYITSFLAYALIEFTYAVRPETLLSSPLTVAANLIIGGGIIFIVTRYRFPADGGPLRIRPLVLSVVFSVIFTIVLAAVIVAGYLFMVITGSAFRGSEDTGLIFCAAITSLLALWACRGIISLMFRR